MGITVIGGLIFSTLLTLVLVPSYFSIAISLEIADRQAFPPAHRQRSARRPDTLFPRSELRLNRHVGY